MVPRLLVVLCSAALLAACGSSALTGEVVEQTRPIAAVDRVLVGDGVGVEIRIDPQASASVSITADSGLLPGIVTSVTGGALEIATPGIVAPDASIIVTIGDRKGVVVDSQARVRVVGVVDRLVVDGAGSASIDLTAVAIGTLDVDLRAAAALTLGEVAEVTGFVGSGAGIRLPTRGPLLDLQVEDGAFLEIEAEAG